MKIFNKKTAAKLALVIALLGILAFTLLYQRPSQDQTAKCCIGNDCCIGYNIKECCQVLENEIRVRGV